MSEARAPGVTGGWAADAAPDPLWARARTGYRARFGRLGFVIDVDTSDPAALDWAARAYGPGAGAAAAGRAADLTLTIVVGPPPGGDGTRGGALGGPALLHPAPTAQRPVGAAPLFREHGPRFVATDGWGGVVVADLAAGMAVAWLDAAAPVATAVAHLLEAPLWRLATWRGWLALHAAAVVVDGVAVVLRGPSGAGKSAAAAAADRAGLAVLAEEAAWLDPVAGRVRASALATTEAAGGAAKAVRPLATVATATDVPLGPLVFLAPPASRRQPPVQWSPTAVDAALRRFEAERIAGEHAQPAERWAQARARLAARAVALAGGTPAQRVAALPEIVAWWRAAGGA